MTTVTIPLDDRQALLEGLGPELRRRILKRYARDSCIASTRMSIDLLRHMGIQDVYGLSVKTRIFNPHVNERIAQLGHMPESEEEWVALIHEPGAWSMGIGFATPDNMGPDRWPGHLVTIVERRWLWDLSLDQAERPDYNMRFPTPVLIPLQLAPGRGEPFLRGREPLLGNWNGMLIRYDAFPQDKSFRATPGWRPGQIKINDEGDSHRRTALQIGLEHRRGD